MDNFDEVPLKPEPPEVLDTFYKMFREFFDLAERKRRWSLTDDIPWDQCNRSLDPAIAEVVQTFCAVELYLPDYLGKLMAQVRGSRGRAWFLANWGYEEAKHSMALEDWLLKSGMRSDEQIADLHSEVFSHEWHLPQDSARGMLLYTVFQEVATRVHYTRLGEIVRREGGCPALEKVLALIAVDEAAHGDFFRRLTAVYLEYDREGTLEQMRRVLNTFRMPSVGMLADGIQRMNQVQSLNIFTEEIFYTQVYQPIAAKLGVDRRELRRKNRREVSTPSR